MNKIVKAHLINMVQNQIEFEEDKKAAGYENYLEDWKLALEEIKGIEETEHEFAPYYLSPAQKKDFKCWLIMNDMNYRSFAKLIGCSRQYVEQVINGQIKITKSIREKFAKGGCNNL